MNAAGSMWCLDENVVDGRVKSKTLLVIISKPEANEDEVTWKKGEDLSSWGRLLIPAAICQPNAFHPLTVVGFALSRRDLSDRKIANIIGVKFLADELMQVSVRII